MALVKVLRQGLCLGVSYLQPFTSSALSLASSTSL